MELKELSKATKPFADGHEAGSLFFACCDFRMRQQVNEFKDQQGNPLIDSFVFPGGVMLFVGGKHGHADMRDGTMYWVKAMVGLHHVKNIKLMVHKMCGAYKAAPALAGKTPEDIFAIQIADAKEAKYLIISQLPEVTVDLYYLDITDANEIVFKEIVE